MKKIKFKSKASQPVFYTDIFRAFGNCRMLPYGWSVLLSIKQKNLHFKSWLYTLHDIKNMYIFFINIKIKLSL